MGDESTEMWIQPFDALQVDRRDLDRRNLTSADQPGQRCDIEVNQIGFGHVGTNLMTLTCNS